MALRQSGKGLVIAVRVVTNANKTRITGEVEGKLKIQLGARPVDGEANAQLIEWFAGTLGIAKSKISIQRGLKSREKEILCECNLTEYEAREKLR